MNAILGYAEYHRCISKKSLTQLRKFKEVYMNEIFKNTLFIFLSEYIGWVLNSIVGVSEE